MTTAAWEEMFLTSGFFFLLHHFLFKTFFSLKSLKVAFVCHAEHHLEIKQEDYDRRAETLLIERLGVLSCLQVRWSFYSPVFLHV